MILLGLDFAPKDKQSSLEIYYLEAGLILYYTPLQGDWKKCFTVTIETVAKKGYRMYVTPGNSDEKVADSIRSGSSSGIVCTKWARIWIGLDRH